MFRSLWKCGNFTLIAFNDELIGSDGFIKRIVSSFQGQKMVNLLPRIEVSACAASGASVLYAVWEALSLGHC